MIELSPSGGSEGYEICDDAVDVSDNGKVADILLIRHKFENLRGKSTRDPRCGCAGWRKKSNQTGEQWRIVQAIPVPHISHILYLLSHNCFYFPFSLWSWTFRLMRSPVLWMICSSDWQGPGYAALRAA